jgi:hypothetical protein
MIAVIFFGFFSAYTPLSFEIGNPYKKFLFFFQGSEKYAKMPVDTRFASEREPQKNWNKSEAERNINLEIKEISE